MAGGFLPELRHRYARWPAKQRPRLVGGAIKHYRMAMLIRLASACFAALLLAGCGTAVAPPGPAGPPGPPGQRGAQFAKPLFADADVTVDADTDVVVARTPLSVTLPTAQNAGRLITVRAAGGAVTVRAVGGERVEQAETIALDDGEMATFMAGGAAGWYVISSSDL